LEEQPIQSSLIRVQSKCAYALNVLIDVAGENRNKESGCQKSSYRHHCSGRCDANAKHDLHNTGCKNYKVRIQWQPNWNLSLKLLPRKGQMTDACID
jgi:hypothetical protein